MSKKKRKQNRRRVAERRKTTSYRRSPKDAAHSYWLTPKVWDLRCHHCGNPGSVAYRHIDQKTLCEVCVESLGVNARESKGWRDGGSKAGSAVTIRHVDPESLRSPPTSPTES